MSVRPATKADIPMMAALLAASFGPDPLLQVMFPYQSQYPQAYVQAVEEYLWCCWYDYSKRLFVSYYESPTDDQQDEEGPGDEQQLLLRNTRPLVRHNQVLTGVAEMERVGKGWEHIYGVWGRLDPRMFSICHSLSRSLLFLITAQPCPLESSESVLIFASLPCQVF